MDNNSLELTNEMIERNDNIDNAVYVMLLELLEKDSNEFPWDMAVIGYITDVIKDALHTEFKLHVRHPGVVTENNG